MCASFPFSFEGGMWDLIVLVIDPCLPFYFSRSCSSSARPGHVAQSVARLTRESEVPDSIPDPVTYFRFSFS